MTSSQEEVFSEVREQPQAEASYRTRVEDVDSQDNAFESPEQPVNSQNSLPNKGGVPSETQNNVFTYLMQMQTSTVTVI